MKLRFLIYMGEVYPSCYIRRGVWQKCSLELKEKKSDVGHTAEMFDSCQAIYGYTVIQLYGNINASGVGFVYCTIRELELRKKGTNTLYCAINYVNQFSGILLEMATQNTKEDVHK